MASSSSQKFALVVLTELSSLLYAGTVFGWAPMLLALKHEGLYRELCPPDGDDWCTERKERLGLIFSGAAVLYSASGVAVGSFLDAFGPAACVALAAASSISGFVLFGMFDATGLDPRWTTVGYSLIALGGMSYFQAAFKAQYAFPRVDARGRSFYAHQTLIMAGVTTLGDASVVMWLVFGALDTRWGVPLATTFIVYSGFTVCISAALVWLWLAVGPEVAAASTPPPEKASGLSYGAVAPVADAPRTPLALRDAPLARQIASLEFMYMMAFAAVHITRGNLFLGLLPYFFESPHVRVWRAPAC